MVRIHKDGAQNGLGKSPESALRAVLGDVKGRQSLAKSFSSCRATDNFFILTKRWLAPKRR